MKIYSIKNGSHSDDTFTYAVLAVGTTEEQAQKISFALNQLAGEYNNELDGLDEILKAYNTENKKTFRDWEPKEIPKYPAQLPKGTTDLAVAFPEIYAKRKEAQEWNEKQREENQAFNKEVDAEAAKYMLPFATPIKEKFPRFTTVFNVDYNRSIGFGKIWNSFYVSSNYYMENEEIEQILKKYTEF